MAKDFRVLFNEQFKFRPGQIVRMRGSRTNARVIERHLTENSTGVLMPGYAVRTLLDFSVKDGTTVRTSQATPSRESCFAHESELDETDEPDDR